MEERDDERLHVSICGAGPAGLLLAQALRMRGIEFTIYEKELESDYTSCPHDYSLAFPWESPLLRRCLPSDLVNMLRTETVCDPYADFGPTNSVSVPCFDGKTGKWMFDLPDIEVCRMSRKKFTNFLSQGLDVQCSRWLSSIAPSPGPFKETIIAKFHSAKTISTYLVVGCDGSNSTVRKSLVGSKAAESRDIGLNIVTTTCRLTGPTARRLRPILWQPHGPRHATRLASHPRGGHLWFSTPISIPDPSRSATWTFENTMSWSGFRGHFGNQSSLVAWWKFQAQTFTEPWRSIGTDLWVPEGVKCRVNGIAAWSPTDVEPWHSRNGEGITSELGGRVTLVGDAAASIPRFGGIDTGMEKALTDAVSLADELEKANDGEQTIAEALAVYEAEMKVRSGRLVEEGVQLAAAWHNFEELEKRHGTSTMPLRKRE